MTRISDETRRNVVRAHIQDVRTIASLVAEYGISKATVSNWVRSYREECQNNDAGLLKKQRHSSRRKSLVAYRFLDEYKQEFGLRWLFMVATDSNTLS